MVGNLSSGDTATLTVEAAVIGTDETVTNTAEVVASDQSDPDSTPSNDDPSEDDQDSASVTGFGSLDAPTTLESIAHPGTAMLA